MLQYQYKNFVTYLVIFNLIGFQQKCDAILFNAEKNLVKLLLIETDSVI